MLDLFYYKLKWGEFRSIQNFHNNFEKISDGILAFSEHDTNEFTIVSLSQALELLVSRPHFSQIKWNAAQREDKAYSCTSILSPVGQKSAFPAISCANEFSFPLPSSVSSSVTCLSENYLSLQQLSLLFFLG